MAIQNKDKHIIIVDTNILWFKDKSVAVNPDFDAFWDDIVASGNFELILPEVVRGELLYQQTESALKAYNKAANHLALASDITNKEYKLRTKRNDIKRHVVQKLDKWINGRKAVVWKTPVKKINWEDICNSAVWRKDVFVADAKNPDMEKGFRDRLILETVNDIVITNGKLKGVILAFICNDKVLRENTERTLLGFKNFHCYERIDDFQSYLKLIEEKLTEQFIRSIMKKAQNKFFRENDFESIFFSEKIRSKIEEKYGDQFHPTDNLDNVGTGLAGASISHRNWEQNKTGTWYIFNTEFKEIVSDRDYHWKNKIQTTFLYRRIVSPSSEKKGLSLAFEFQFEEKAMFLEFIVHWKADVRNNGAFYNISVEDIQMTKNDFRKPTEDEKKLYGLV